MENYTWTIVIVFLLTSLIYYTLVFTRKKKYNLPPGPYAYPIIGSIIQLARIDSKIPMKAIQVLRKKYGPVISLQLGSVYAVGFNGFDTIKELETNLDFMDRTNEKFQIDKSLGLPLGLIFSEYGFWTKTRPTVHRLIKEYGFGRNKQMYGTIMNEITDFLDIWKNQCSENKEGWAKVHIERQFQLVMLNIIWSIGTGERFHGHDDPKLKKLSDITNIYMISAQIGNGLVGLFPQLMYRFPKITGYDKMLKNSHEFFTFFDEIIQERIELGCYQTSQLNFIDSFLKLICDNNPSGIGTEPKLNILENIYTRENLIAILQDFSLGGNDTTANTINFIIRYLVKNPKIQEKIHEEIDRVVGHNRQVIVEDKSKMLYVQAVIFEGLRLASPVPTIPRVVLKDSKFRGYDIPEGTLILPNYYGANWDELTWENPETFKPERFLNPSGTELINTDKILSFGIGKRYCIGENVAKTSLFFILTSVFQRFSFEVDPEFGVPSTGIVEGLTRNTEPYNVIIRQKY